MFFLLLLLLVMDASLLDDDELGVGVEDDGLFLGASLRTPGKLFSG